LRDGTADKRSPPSQPANDNEPNPRHLRAVMLIPQSLPVQFVEVEVLAELLDAIDDLAANDNEVASS
jgi:hypothetical protein